jgi:hypothetical protein
MDATKNKSEGTGLVYLAGLIEGHERRSPLIRKLIGL